MIGRRLGELQWRLSVLHVPVRPRLVLPLPSATLRGHRHRGDGTQHLMALQASFLVANSNSSFYSRWSLSQSLSQSVTSHFKLWIVKWVTQWSVTNRRKSLSCYSQLKILTIGYEVCLRVRDVLLPPNLNLNPRTKQKLEKCWVWRVKLRFSNSGV